jgi:leucyl aminopeptidase
MDIDVITGHIEDVEADAIVIGLLQDKASPLPQTVAKVDQALKGAVTTLVDSDEFKGKRNEVIVLYTYGLLPAQRIILVGLGKACKLSPDVIRQAAASAAKQARKLGITTLHTLTYGVTSGEPESGEPPEAEQPSAPITLAKAIEAIVEGTILGLYRFRELKTDNSDNHQTKIERLVLISDAPTPEANAAIRAGAVIAESTVWARDLVNRPANIACPAHIVEHAQAEAHATGLTCRVLNKEELAALGMDLFLSVNQGSDKPAQMVILEHNVDRKDLPTVVLVGKGITFDTGGISLKPSQHMEKMKGDMGGAAAVLGALRAVALLDLPLHVVGLTPLTENMPDARATKPGDVFTSLKGLTVEIINTDAEGRLILADALTYARTFNPDALFDIATLTGGRIIALGDHAAAVMGDEALIQQLRTSGDATGERVWPLPLFEAYGEQLKSEVADVKNVGGRAASSITAGFFLSKFVPDKVAWVHIDIAGLGLVDKDRPYVPKGATGFGVRLFVEMLRQWQ